VVVLVSGAGTNLQALIDASKDPQYPADVVAVGSDRTGIEGLARAEDAGIPTFVVQLSHFERRAQWDAALADHVAEFSPDLVVLAGFMKLNGPTFLARFPDRVINTHPALLPSFPGTHGPRDALQHGVKVTGCTIFIVDEGVDTGPIVAQAAVAVMDGDSEESLHRRIKEEERQLLVQTVAKMVTTPYRVEERKVVWS
jgi:phosphoribosylglycinamide formyltransferase-1